MKNKYLLEEELERELNNYIYNTKTNYALLLNGSWGSGKTFFIKNYIAKLTEIYNIKEKNKKHKEKNDCKRPIYISLYGINTIAEIKINILLAIHESTKLKKFTPYISFATQAAAEYIKSNTNIDLREILDISSKYNLVIFIDDVERCDIQINTLLGYINELVEHNNIKVILTADEEKIGRANYNVNLEMKYLVALSSNLMISKNNDNKSVLNTMYQNSKEINTNKNLTKSDLINRSREIFNENTLYNEIKEKVIGKTIYFRSNISKIYKLFVRDIVTNKDASKVALKSEELVIRITEENEHHNLRTIQFILESYNHLALESINLIDINEIKEVYLNDLFSYCLIKSMKIKQGKNSYNWEKNQEYGVIYLGDKLIDEIYGNYTTGFKFVDDYLLNSYFNKERTKKVLTDYKDKLLNEKKNPEDPINMLKNWWLIPEDDIEILLDKLLKNIEENKYNLGLYSTIVSLLSKIEMMDISISKIKRAIKLLEKNIESEIVQGNYSESVIFDGSEEANTIYKRNIKKIKELSNSKENKDFTNEINNIVEEKKWGEKFKKFCYNNQGIILNKCEFINMIEIDKVIDNISTKDIEQIYEFWYGLQRIYSFSDVKKYFKKDLTKLEELKIKMSQIKADKVKKYVINKIIDYLEEVISKLK